MTSTTQTHRTYYQSLDIYRLILAFLSVSKPWGFPTGIGSYLQAFSSFAVPSFYIISGFLELQEGDDFEPRLLKAIKRTGITFLILMIFKEKKGRFYMNKMNAPELEVVRFQSEDVLTVSTAAASASLLRDVGILRYDLNGGIHSVDPDFNQNENFKVILEVAPDTGQFASFDIFYAGDGSVIITNCVHGSQSGSDHISVGGNTAQDVYDSIAAFAQPVSGKF